MVQNQTQEVTIAARIIEEQKNYYVVSTAKGNARASIRGILKKEKKRICAGDLVDFTFINEDTMEGQIHKVHERTTYLPRPPIANISQVLFINTLYEPSLDLDAVDRFLFTAAAYQLKAILVFNKIDILDKDDKKELDRIISIYTDIGYTCMTASAEKNKGIDKIIEVCDNKISAFAGLSGVGKSTILQRIFPKLEFRTNEVSGVNGRGTHTTTNVSLIPIENGFIADTPGFVFVDIPTVPEEDVAAYFPELEKRIGQCRFNNCIHKNEPGCVVREALEKGEIVSWRHEHYLKIFSEMKDRRKEYR